VQEAVVLPTQAKLALMVLVELVAVEMVRIQQHLQLLDK
jgi:hypothetical protein